MVGPPLPQAAIDASKASVTQFYSHAMSIGFVAASLGHNQAIYSLIKNINEWVPKDGYTNFPLYYVNDECPIITPQTACFASPYSKYQEGNLIALDIFGWNSAKANRLAAKFFYVYDPLILAHVPTELVDQLRTNAEGFHFISRSFAHRDLLERQFGIKCIQECVPNAEIESFIRIIKKYGKERTYDYGK